MAFQSLSHCYEWRGSCTQENSLKVYQKHWPILILKQHTLLGPLRLLLGEICVAHINAELPFQCSFLKPAWRHLCQHYPRASRQLKFQNCKMSSYLLHSILKQAQLYEKLCIGHICLKNNPNLKNDARTHERPAQLTQCPAMISTLLSHVGCSALVRVLVQ